MQFDVSKQARLFMDDIPITISVPEFGEIVYGLGRSGSYEAVKAGGAIPIVNVQGKMRVPWRVGLRRLAGDDSAVLDELTKDFISKLRKRQKKAA
jgi:hypothetical protein